MTKHMSIKVNDGLYDLIAKEADRRNLPLIDVVIESLAKRFKRPDLNFVERKLAGRPHGKKSA